VLEVELLYNKIEYSKFKKLFTCFDFDKYLNYMGIDKLPDYIIVTNLEYIQQIDKLFNKDYLIWQIFTNSLIYLDEDMRLLHHSFYNKVLLQINNLRSLELHILTLINKKLGDLIGQLYGKKYFTDMMKNEIKKMVDNIKTATKDILKNSWLEESTKKKGIEKLDNIKFKIGYPDEIMDYSKLKLYGDFFIQSKLISIYKIKYYMNKLYNPPNKKLWDMNAHEVNAYYSPTSNVIGLPAGILKLPFFDINRHFSLNYGAIGATIGHEIIHAFDDEGRNFDASGNMIDWWSSNDDKQYKNKIIALVKHYDNLKFIIDNQEINVNGKLTLGENIADIYGVIVSLNGMKLHNKHEDTDIKNFFISYAANWRRILKPNIFIQKIKTDPHAPAPCRVNQIVKQIPDFIRIFNIKESDPMYPKESFEIFKK
jgi:putative endopeptidase